MGGGPPVMAPLSHATIVAVSAAAIGALAVLKAVDDSDVDPHEDNTFGLPDGTPLREALRRRFAEQEERVLSALPDDDGTLPQQMPTPDNTGTMAAELAPFVEAYWDESGKKTRARLGL